MSAALEHAPSLLRRALHLTLVSQRIVRLNLVGLQLLPLEFVLALRLGLAQVDFLHLIRLLCQITHLQHRFKDLPTVLKRGLHILNARLLL